MHQGIENYEAFPFVTLRKACELLEVSAPQMYKLVGERRIPSYKPNNKMLYFNLNDLKTWMESGKIESTEEVESNMLRK